MNTKLTDTKATILQAAAGRSDGNIEPLPSNLRGGARTKGNEGLLARRLNVEVGDRHLLTDASYTAVGTHHPLAKGVQKMDAPDGVVKHDTTDNLTKRETMSRTIRPGSKLAAIIDAMRHPGSATIAQMMTGTG